MAGPITIVLDIETVGPGPGDPRLDAITEMAAAAERDVAAFAALSPALAQVVCVGMMQLETRRRHVVYDLRRAKSMPAPKEGFGVHGADGEAGLLKAVNEILTKASRLVTFNGRCFDLAVLVHRMLARGVTPCTTLLKAWREYRFKPNVHIDVRDLLTNFGAVNGPGTSLRAFALGLELPDPKANGSGADVAELVGRGDMAALCEYCLGDVETTACLYERFTEACGVA